MKFERVSIMVAVMLEILSLVIAFLLLLLILFVFVPYTWLWYTLLWTLGAITIGVTFIYVPFLYLNCEYGIDEKVVVLKKGVLLHSTQILYRDRIAFVSVYHNPLTPLLHVSTLRISAVGGNMTILFINTKRAEQMAAIMSK